MDEDQQRRVAENEVRFRAMNEAVTAAVDSLEGGVTSYEVMCECALDDCEEMISITPEQYAHVRSSPRWFAVRPDHIVEEAEQAVEDHDAWWIVEKTGAGAIVAQRSAT